jgi:peptidoglycan/xylan/chitin deacetylase (PgdA/CDA1 family)
MKSAVLNLMRVSGAFELMRLMSRRRALILTYHRFSKDDEEGKTSAREFVEQLEYLTSHYQIVPLSRMVEYIKGPGPLPPGLAAITIDDGYADSYDVAYPLLLRYSAPATVFVVTEFSDQRAWIWTDKARYLASEARPQRLTTKIGGRELSLDIGGESSRRQASESINALLKRLPDKVKEDALEQLSQELDVELTGKPPGIFSAITWDQAREMEANGIEIGSHTMTHPILTNIDAERLRRELQGSKSRLEEVLGHRVDQFCYPNGDNDGRVQCEVARAGYRVAVTIVNGLNNRGDDPLTLRRVHTERDLAHFLQGTSGFEEFKGDVRFFRRKLLQPQN